MNSELTRFSKVVSQLCCQLRHGKLSASKVELKKRGYTYRSAAPVIRRSYHWICQVVNGRATSRPVLEAIFNLPVRDKKGAAQ